MTTLFLTSSVSSISLLRNSYGEKDYFNMQKTSSSMSMSMSISNINILSIENNSVNDRGTSNHFGSFGDSDSDSESNNNENNGSLYNPERVSKIRERVLERVILGKSDYFVIDYKSLSLSTLSSFQILELLKKNLNFKKLFVSYKKRLTTDVSSIDNYFKLNFSDYSKTLSIEIIKKLHKEELIEPVESFKLAGSFLTGTSRYLPDSNFYIRDEIPITELVKKSPRETFLMKNLLLEKSYIVLISLIACCKKNNNTSFANELIEFIHFHEILGPLTEKFVDVRYLKENECTLLRESKPDTWFWSLIFKKEGSLWIHKLLFPLIILLDKDTNTENFSEIDFVCKFIRDFVSQLEKILMEIDFVIVKVVQSVANITNKNSQTAQGYLLEAYLF
eukprot:TRINITY_DN17850_c0_g1_i1.p1 TRINITY_DN17850_c0_g1~~TRINITY_DN17850_c0_g1_i1.p1  ORF type:complete len:391 (-),score=76.19 TRINITY_DN17850_c0_g1_i1:417-1589(-)